jgi:hypothetical protein
MEVLLVSREEEEVPGEEEAIRSAVREREREVKEEAKNSRAKCLASMAVWHFGR